MTQWSEARQRNQKAGGGLNCLLRGGGGGLLEGERAASKYVMLRGVEVVRMAEGQAAVASALLVAGSVQSSVRGLRSAGAGNGGERGEAREPEGVAK